MTSLPDRAAKKILTGVSSKLWDLEANLMEDIVEQHGPIRSVSWFARNMPTYEKILKDWGPIRTHFLATALSVVNGCAYCSYGHAYAFQLHYFQQNDRLFPLSEQEMLELIGEGETRNPSEEELRQTTAQQTLAQSLVEADLADEVDYMDRAFELRETRSPANDDDKRLLHLADMFAWLNSCGIKGGTTPDGAHDPINKDRELQQRYRLARVGSD